MADETNEATKTQTAASTPAVIPAAAQVTAPAAATTAQNLPKPKNLKTPPAGVNNQGAPNSDTSTVDTVGSSKTDSEGKALTEAQPIGPRGTNTPGDVQGIVQKPVQIVNDSTVAIDSAGNPKTEPTQIGPRGASAWHVKDSYHAAK
jgi:hypothetical protein